MNREDRHLLSEAERRTVEDLEARLAQATPVFWEKYLAPEMAEESARLEKAQNECEAKLAEWALVMERRKQSPAAN